MQHLRRPFNSLYSLFYPLSSFTEFVPISISILDSTKEANKKIIEEKNTKNFSVPIHLTPLVEYRTSRTRLWINDNSKQAKLEVFEDEMDDYPYNHTMKYEIDGTLNENNTLFSVKTMKYTTYVVDDLFPTSNTETIHVVQVDRDHFERLKNVKDLQNDPSVGFPTYKWDAYTMYVPLGSININLTSKEGIIICEWLRFYRKWAKDTDGYDVTKGFVPSVIKFIPANKLASKL